MNVSNLYILAVRINGEEFIANFSMGSKVCPVHYSTLEEAKDLFSIVYKILSAGPGQNTPVFAVQFEKMAIFRPAYIKLPRLKSVDIITEARADNDVVTFDEISLLPQPLSYFKVKKGFIDKYLALDLLRDIESVESVGPNGKIIINQFNVRDLSHGEPSDDSDIERDPDEILRKRGLL